MTALLILFVAAVLALLNYRFMGPDPQSNVFCPSMLYVRRGGYVVIVVGLIAALIVWA